MAFSNLNGVTALGRITQVDPAARRCRVKAIGTRHDGSQLDQDLTEVRWICMAAHPEGDEDTYIPRPGQYGCIIFIENEPYLFGYFQPATEGGAPIKSQEPLTIGDRIIKTIAGNKLIIRSGGTVEIESTKICRTYWIPSRNLINSVCREWELETDGGYMYWRRDPESNDTNLNFVAYDNLQPTYAVDLSLGRTPSESALEMHIGPVDDDQEVSEPALSAYIESDGTTYLEINKTKMTLWIDSKTGDIEMTTEGKVTQTIKGDVDQTIQEGNLSQTVAKGNVELNVDTGNVVSTIKGTMTATVEGAVKIDTKATADVNAEGAVTVSTKATADVKAEADITLDSKAKVTVKAASGIELDGGGGATSKVHTFPESLSDFTGAPIMPGSSTVKASK